MLKRGHFEEKTILTGLCVIILGFAGILSSQTLAGARIQLADDTADFGEVKPKSVHSFTYRFKNVGSEELVISRIQSTCGCTVPDLKKKKYAPEESGELKVAYTAPSREGETTKHLYIHSNDPANPRYPLLIKSSTVLKASVEPGKIDLSLDKENAGFPELKVYSRDNKEFAIKSVNVNGNPFSFDLDPKNRRKVHTIKPQVDKEELKKFLNGVIRIKIDHPECDTLTVTYNTLSQYSASPARIIVQNAQPGEKETRDVWIKNNYGNKIDLGDITSKKGYIDYEITENKDGMAKLEVTITAPPKEGKSRYFSDELFVDIKDSDELNIKVSGWYAR